MYSSAVDDQCLFLEKDRDLCPEMQPVWVVHKSQCKLAIRCRKGFTKDECQKNCMHGVNNNEATTTETAETAETTEAAETAESNPPSEVEETPEPPNKDDEN